MNFIKTTFCTLAITSLLAAVSYAQGGNGVIEGTVAHASGGVIEKAVVTATLAAQDNNGRSVSFEGVTDQYGRFSIEGLPAGSYRVVASSKGFKFIPEERLVLAKGGNASLSLELGTETEPCSNVTVEEMREVISLADEARIIDMVLDEAYAVYVRLYAGDKTTSDLRSKVPLANENIKLNWMSETSLARFEPLSKDKIEEIAVNKGRVEYVYLNRIEFKPGCAVVKASVGPLFPRDAGIISLEGDYRTYELRKFDGSWQLRLVDWMIS